MQIWKRVSVNEPIPSANKNQPLLGTKSEAYFLRMVAMKKGDAYADNEKTQRAV